MKKTLPLIGVIVGAFFVWQWYLGRRHPALYAQQKEQEANNKRSEAAQGAQMVKQPPLAAWDPQKTAWENVSLNVTQAVFDGVFKPGTERTGPTEANRNPQVFGFLANVFNN